MKRYVEVESFVEQLLKVQESNNARPFGVSMNIGLNQAIEVANYMAFEAVEEKDEG